MTENNKQDMFSQPIPTIRIIDESNSFSTESQKPKKVISSTPPDSLMYPLFDAIQRKSWTKAKKLCRELILLDPNKLSYLELYIRLEQITDLINERLYPQSATSRTTSTTSNETSK